MASPFSVFRKRQKVLMALACLLAIIAFVFLPLFMDSSRGLKVQNPVVVETTQFGNLTERDISIMVQQRRKVLNVLTLAMQSGGAPQNWIKHILDGQIGPATEESVVNYWLLARRAEKMGMVIGKQTIIDFLKRLTGGTITGEMLQKALAQSGITDLQFRSALRDELLAMQFNILFQISIQGQTPAERWQYFLRVKQMASIEAAPVPVSKYIDKIPDPGDEKLIAFFDSYKDKYPMPNSPDPGLREPQKVALQWFKADIEKLSSPSVISEAEVLEHYKKNKDRYDQAEKKPEAAKPAETKKEEKAAPKDAKEVTEPKQEKAAPKETKEPKQEKAATKETKEPKQEKSPAKDSKDTKGEKDAKEPQKEKTSKDTSAVNRSVFIQTAYQQEKPAEKVSGEKAPAKPQSAVDAKKPSDEKKPQSAVDAKKPSDEKKPQAAAEAKKPSDEKKPQVAAEKAKEKPVEKPAEKAKAGPSDALKETIRREIAFERIRKGFDSLREQLAPYSRQWSEYRVLLIQTRGKKKPEGSDKPLPAPPTPPDFEKLAKPFGFTTGKTPLVAQWELQDMEIGASMVGARDPLGPYVFSSMAQFRPEVSIDTNSNLYLFWKTDEKKDSIPQFKDPGVRERVLQAYRMVEARPLAIKQAETLAAEARKSKESLKKAFAAWPDVRVVAPPAFSWITFGNVPLGSTPNARINTVSDVDGAGEDFMRAVFQMEPGQTATAMNAAQTTAYVIRLTKLEPSQKVLLSQFEAEDFNKYASAGLSDQQQIAKGWLDGIKAAAGFKWMRKHDREADSELRETQETE
jgi:hypothetical protein